MNDDWQPSILDLLIASGITILFPFIAGGLFRLTGALLPMLLYYLLAWGIVKCRRGKTGYFNPIKNKLPKSFLLNMGIIIISLFFAYQARVIDVNTTLVGVLFTLFVWAPINASSEQLLWIYIFESFDLYPSADSKGPNGVVFTIVGLILFSAFVGLIHTVFWVGFLHSVNPEVTAGLIFIVLTGISGFVHILVWRESSNMLFTFIPHLLLNMAPTLWTGYSLLPYLLL